MTITIEQAFNELKDSLETGYQPHQESLELAIMALEKQIPLKPTYNSVSRDYYCKTCGASVLGSGDYCWNCGQSIKWD